MIQYEKNPTRITEGSFAMIQREMGEMGIVVDSVIAPIIERMIHSSADFDFGTITRYTTNAVQSGVDAIGNGCPIVCDVNMIRVGISAIRTAQFGNGVHCFVSDPEAFTRAKAEATTRSVIGIRMAHERGLIEGGIVVIGNAPTALYEVIELIEQGVRPALVVGVPVGFISSVESKDALIAQVRDVDWIATQGRKGGSPIAVSVVNALLRLAAESPRTETD
ncbi:MAG: precorrin-8X methylmutase [Candidatus Promineifilaceae bacterium]